MRLLNYSIIISGKICSGKSSIAKNISDSLNIPIASFSEYLVDLAKKQTLPTDRESLQNLGNSLIIKDHLIFLNDVMDFSNPVSDKFIFEGVRHNIIFDTIIKNSKTSKSIFLDTNEELRLQRFLKRSKEMDKNLTAADFYKRQEHPVEKEVADIKAKSLLVLSEAPSIESLSKSLSI